MSHRDSLLQPPYNQVLIPLLSAPVRLFSWDLPYHPVGVEPNSGIHAWTEAVQRQEDFMTPFIEKSLSHLNDLKEKHFVIPVSTLSAGLSRGAYAAFLLAAASADISGTAAFAPLIDFHGHNLAYAHQLASNGSEALFRFMTRGYTLKRSPPFFKISPKKTPCFKPDIELTLYPSIGYQGHGTPENDVHRRGTSHFKETCAMMLSVVIPVKNEEENIQHLCVELFSVLKEINEPFEVVIVDDGSTDGTLPLLRKTFFSIKRAKVSFYKNYGQTAAFLAGFRAAMENGSSHSTGMGKTTPTISLNF